MPFPAANADLRRSFMQRSRRRTILLAGMVAADPYQGGATWAVLQYLLGFQRLGHDVYLVEPIPADFRDVKPAFLTTRCARSRRTARSSLRPAWDPRVLRRGRRSRAGPVLALPGAGAGRAALADRRSGGLAGRGRLARPLPRGARCRCRPACGSGAADPVRRRLLPTLAGAGAGERRRPLGPRRARTAGRAVWAGRRRARRAADGGHPRRVYASNVLVQDAATGLRICPIDWETTALGPGRSTWRR